MIYTNGQGKEYYYFTPVKGSFGGAQICDVWGGAIEKTAILWKKTNGFSHTFVYDLNHNFVGEF